MTDAEFDLLVLVAASPPSDRAALIATRRPGIAAELRSFIAQDVLSFLLGRSVRGTAAKAWLALVEQEAGSVAKERAKAS